MKMPWKKREEQERERRLAAERRAMMTEKDWIQLRRHKHSIDKEIERNDWTSTAITLFSGKNPN